MRDKQRTTSEDSATQLEARSLVNVASVIKGLQNATLKTHMPNMVG